MPHDIPVPPAQGDETDALSAKARRQAAVLNSTLDALEKIGVTATVCPPLVAPIFSPGVTVSRVRLVLTEPPHHKPAEPESQKVRR